MQEKVQTLDGFKGSFGGQSSFKIKKSGEDYVMDLYVVSCPYSNEFTERCKKEETEMFEEYFFKAEMLKSKEYSRELKKLNN